MHGLTGTLRLVRLALRRDRFKLPAWILGLAAVMTAQVPALIEIYGKSAEAQLQYITTTAPSLASRIFGGPIGSPALGDIMINETFLFTAIAIAFMSTLTVIRHTRQNEETGRSELINSAIVARHASLAAALIVAIGANVVLSALLAVVFVANDLPASGSIATAAALGAIGIAFAGVAAITAQISESARGANGQAAMVIGVAFLLRAVGDSLGDLTADKMSVVSAWPSWLSPLGWGQQLYPYTKERWWVFALFAVFSLVVIAVAFYLNGHRDLGRGLVETRRGPANAPKSLHTAWGLARRLQRGVLRGWVIGIAIMGVMLGLISKEFENLFKDNADAQSFLEQLGGEGGFNDMFFAAMMAIMAICIGGYVVQALQRMRTEEASGQLEGVLATSVSRQGWMLSHIGYATMGVVLQLLVLGVTSGISYVLIADASWSEAWDVILSAVVHIPAVLALGGFAVAVFGAFPRASIAVSWSAFGAALLIGQFGEVLKLPQAVMNLSPFTHTPNYPVESIAATPLLLIATAAVAFTAAGIALFRRRNLTIG